MARIDVCEEVEATLYRWHGHTGETVECAPLPDKVVQTFALEVVGGWSYNGEGSIVYQRKPGRADTVCLVTQTEAQEAAWIRGKQNAHAEAQEERPVVVRAKDGTFVREGFDWKLDARPEAVKQSGLELRADYICEKYPATTKAGFREKEHRMATLIIERGERGRKWRTV